MIRLLIILVLVLNLNKNERVYYIPFDIPGKQMAATIPPFGIFIEEKYTSDGDGPGSVLSHERVHWNKQYKEMGLIKFYYNYASVYIKHGRIDNWMEDEARELSMIKYK